MNNFLTLNLLVLVGSLIALVGGLIALKIKPLAKLLRQYATAFASGILLAVSLVGLLPEAVHELEETAFPWLLGAFLATYLFEYFVFELHHHEDDDHDHQHSSVLLVILGDTIHNFIDGATIAAAYLAGPALGITTAISTFLHEVPHEMADFGVMLQAGWKKRKIILVNIWSALSSFVGAWLVWLVASELAIIGQLLAISAGIFLYLGASDFLPKHGKKISRKKAVAMMLFGVILMLLVFRLIPHEH